MKRDIRDAVWERAASRCEYCQIPQRYDIYTREIDHIFPFVHGGLTELPNLALACWFSNCHKGPNMAGLDTIRNRGVLLFHPRRQIWNNYFRWNNGFLEGINAVGLATIAVLRINHDDRVALRRHLISRGITPFA